MLCLLFWLIMQFEFEFDNYCRAHYNPGSILMMYVTLRNVAVTSRRNVANQRSNVIIIARKEGGAWER